MSFVGVRASAPSDGGATEGGCGAGEDSAVISVSGEAVDNFFATLPKWGYASKSEPRLYVVNPLYPYSNNTRNVTPAQLRHLHDEFRRAAAVLDPTAGRGGAGAPSPW